MKRYNFNGQVERVIDGDTMDIIVDLGFKIKHKIRVRLYGIDAPEVRGRGKTKGIILAKKISAFFSKNPFVEIETYKKGKYGRHLAILYTVNGENLNMEIDKLIKGEKSEIIVA